MCLPSVTQCSKRDVAFGLDQKKSSLRLKSENFYGYGKNGYFGLNTLRSSLKEEIWINGLTAEGNAWRLDTGLTKRKSKSG